MGTGQDIMDLLLIWKMIAYCWEVPWVAYWGFSESVIFGFQNEGNNDMTINHKENDKVGKVMNFSKQRVFV